MKIKTAALLLLTTLFSAAAQAKTFNHAVWEGIVKTNVDKDGFVDYDSIRISKGGDIYEYISFLETARLSELSDAEKTAFWINAYNATVVQMILTKPQMQKVSEDTDMFDRKITVANLKLSLNDIEHRILFSDPQKGGPIKGYSVPFDPRVHFVLVRGTISCPRLLNHAYNGATLQDRLQSAAKEYANSDRHIWIENGQLHLSQLIQWAKDDFETVGGAISYLSNLIDPALRPDAKDILAQLKSDYPDKIVFEYDWTLNHIRNRPKQ